QHIHGARQGYATENPREDLFSSLAGYVLHGRHAVSRLPGLRRRIQSHGTRPLRKTQLCRRPQPAHTPEVRRPLRTRSEIFSSLVRRRRNGMGGRLSVTRKSFFAGAGTPSWSRPRSAGTPDGTPRRHFKVTAGGLRSLRLSRAERLVGANEASEPLPGWRLRH